MADNQPFMTLRDYMERQRGGVPPNAALDQNGLPDIDWAERRRRAIAAQSPVDRWFDDHDQNMRNFMHQATGLIPGAHAAARAYQHWVDPEHPITQDGRSIPWAIANGLLAAGELGTAGVGNLAGRFLSGRAPFADVRPSRVPLPEEAPFPRNFMGEAEGGLPDAIPAVAGLLGGLGNVGPANSCAGA